MNRPAGRAEARIHYAQVLEGILRLWALPGRGASSAMRAHRTRGPPAPGRSRRGGKRRGSDQAVTFASAEQTLAIAASASSPMLDERSRSQGTSSPSISATSTRSVASPS